MTTNQNSPGRGLAFHTMNAEQQKEPLPVENVSDWLAANLGYDALAPLTGTDKRALRAAEQIIELYSYHRRECVLEAFALVVSTMQPHTQELAYHAVARGMEWSDRCEIWNKATRIEPSLQALLKPRVCAFEPGGCHKDMREDA